MACAWYQLLRWDDHLKPWVRRFDPLPVETEVIGIKRPDRPLEWPWHGRSPFKSVKGATKHLRHAVSSCFLTGDNAIREARADIAWKFTLERWERMERTSSSAGLVRSSSAAQEAAQCPPDTGRSCPSARPATAAASTWKLPDTQILTFCDKPSQPPPSIVSNHTAPH